MMILLEFKLKRILIEIKVYMWKFLRKLEFKGNFLRVIYKEICDYPQKTFLYFIFWLA